MEHTVSLKLNHVFRRLYGRGKSAVNPCLAVYCRKNNLGYSRLGLTVGVKPTAVTGSWSARSCLWRTSSACSGRRGPD